MVINKYSTVGFRATISRLLSVKDDDPGGSNRKVVLEWKQQRAYMEQRAGTAATSSHQRGRDRGLEKTLPQSAETLILNWVNAFHHDGVHVSPAMLVTRVFEEAKQLNIPRGVFPAKFQ